MIDNNYMINAGSGSEDIDRPVWTQMYEYKPGYGQYKYDSENDVYVYVGNGGDYIGHQDKMFIAYVFEINEYMHCPNTYVSPRKIWAQTGNYELQLSEITQVKKGTYQISIVDENGNVATDLSSVPVTFYLNKEGKSATPKEGDVYKTVMMKNGTATVKFDASDFKETGNVLTAVFPTPGTNIDSKVSKTLVIDDSDIPGEVTDTKIIVSNFTTYPLSNEDLVATLTDINGNAVAGETLSFAVKNRVYNITTDSYGQSKLPIGLAKEGSYEFNITFAGSEDYYGSSAQAYVVVKYSSKTAILAAPVITVPPRAGEDFTVNLTSVDGRPLAGETVYMKINGKTYSEVTDVDGQASLTIRLAAEKTFPVLVTYKGSEIYKPTSANGTVIVSIIATDLECYDRTFSLSSPDKYQITLKDEFGKALSNQNVSYSLNGENHQATTDNNGKINVDISNLGVGSYELISSYDGDDKYKPVTKTAAISIVEETGIIFVDRDLPNSEIQHILDNAADGSDVEFLGEDYSNISLNVNNGLNIYSRINTTLMGNSNSPVFNVEAENVNISGFTIRPMSCDGVVISNSQDVSICNNSIINSLDE